MADRPNDAGARLRILDAALVAFAERGYAGATTSGIARAAGVTQPLVHYHFATKDDLWRAVVDRELVAVADHFAGIVDQLGDLDDLGRLKVLVRRLVQFVAERPELGRIMSYEAATGGERLEWMLGHGGPHRLDAIDGLLSAAMAAGHLRPMPIAHVTTCLVASAAYFFIARHLVAHLYGLDVEDPEVVRVHADTVVALFFHGLAPGAPSPGGDPTTTEALA